MLTINSSVAVYDSCITFHIFDDKNKFYEGRVEFASVLEEIKVILRTTVVMDLLRYIPDNGSIFEAFLNLSKHYGKDVEQQIT
eukprot:snap_masked-scaffold_69-processed-gene-0.36-mRNA-1 protein AED:1.00 eAED:1.00 QI:0/-1/0/0/-1/1/1/0/82